MQIMISEDLNRFSISLPKQGRLLGLDLVAKTIGLALSDISRRKEGLSLFTTNS
ncbi:uncharacterized protein METZ01_LOCUS473661, partial [marine metagenome]